MLWASRQSVSVDPPAWPLTCASSLPSTSHYSEPQLHHLLSHSPEPEPPSAIVAPEQINRKIFQTSPLVLVSTFASKNKLEQCMIWKHCREAGFCSTSTLTLDTFLIKRTVLFRCNSVFSCLTSVNDLNTSCGLIARMSSLSPKCTYNSVFKGINEKQNDKMIWMFWNHVLLSMKTQLQFVNSVKANQSVASSTRSPSGQHFFSEYVKATYECTQ